MPREEKKPKRVASRSAAIRRTVTTSVSASVIFDRVEILGSFIEQHAADESIYDKSSIDSERRHADIARILQ